MNIKDGIQVASMVKDVYIICADLPKNVNFDIEIDTEKNRFEVCIKDCRQGETEYSNFTYNRKVSPEQNALCLRVWLATVL